jgi:hypothetical protein
MEFNLYRFCDDQVHVSGFFGKDSGVLQVDMMTQVYIVFRHGGLLQMVEMVMLFDRGPSYIWFVQYS